MARFSFQTFFVVLSNKWLFLRILSEPGSEQRDSCCLFKQDLYSNSRDSGQCQYLCSASVSAPNHRLMAHSLVASHHVQIKVQNQKNQC